MATLSRLEPVGDVGHLVQQCIRTLGPVVRKHQVAIECDLDDIAGAVMSLSWHHVTERGTHAIAEPDRHVRREDPLEPGVIEISIDLREVCPLFRRRAAVRDLTLTSGLPGAVLVSLTQSRNFGRQFWPGADRLGGAP